MSRVIFNVAGKCDKAGRAQNQDNYWICPNLEKPTSEAGIGKDTDIDLSHKGALLVVADGMGGMKSGEKASEFVIEGIKRKFALIPDQILNDDLAIQTFIKNAIADADGMIKMYAKNNPESEGMGSTVVLVWLLGEKAYCGWCGDSRVYCYNPQNSLVRLSHDHSYVQDLVDEGKITEEEAFDHPDGNIITRSIGDSGERVNPETKVYPIHRRDVFMLCSDGLCGLLTDQQIESILADNCTSSEDALKALWAAGEKEGFSDNCTIEVACVTDGGVTPTRKAVGYDEGRPKPVAAAGTAAKKAPVPKETAVSSGSKSVMKYVVMIAAALILVGVVAWFFSRGDHSKQGTNQEYTYEGGNEAYNYDKGDEPMAQPIADAGQPMPQNPSNNAAKPDKPQSNGTSAPVAAAQPTQNAAQNQPEPSQSVSKPSNDYLSMLRTTQGSVREVENIISRASLNGGFSNEGEKAKLENFVKNASSLVNQPDAKVLDANQNNILGQIKNTAVKANKALRDYKVKTREPENKPDEPAPTPTPPVPGPV